jgi:hypothetical protein
MTSVELILGQLYQLVGNAVLLPLPFGEKRPVVPGWQTTTYQASMEPAYQRWLKAAIDRNGNVGVLLGTVSDHLCAIDIDNDNRVEPFLALNPALCDTLRTRGRRGCQIWIRVSGEYPAKVHKLRALDGTKPIEWRGGGGCQSVIWGKHPCGERYTRIVGRPVKEIRFSDINWPSDLVLPWRRPNQPATPKRPRPPANGNLQKRIEAYIAAMPGAISGNNGHGQTFKVAIALIEGWGLSIDEAWPYLLQYNAGCQPAWSEKELRHKLKSAEQNEDKSCKGHLIAETNLELR